MREIKLKILKSIFAFLNIFANIIYYTIVLLMPINSSYLKNRGCKGFDGIVSCYSSGLEFDSQHLHKLNKNKQRRIK